MSAHKQKKTIQNGRISCIVPSLHSRAAWFNSFRKQQGICCFKLLSMCSCGSLLHVPGWAKVKPVPREGGSSLEIEQLCGRVNEVAFSRRLSETSQKHQGYCVISDLPVKQGTVLFQEQILLWWRGSHEITMFGIFVGQEMPSDECSVSSCHISHRPREPQEATAVWDMPLVNCPRPP